MRNRVSYESRGGFTLVELAIVIFIIGIVAAVAFPQLIPILSFSQAQGSARHVSGFGRAAMQQAQLFRETIFVRFDLDAQEYFAVRVYTPSEEGEGEGEGTPDYLSQLSEARGSGMSPAEMSELLAQGGAGLEAFGAGFDPDGADQQMNDKCAKFTRDRLLARAKNVKHEQSILDQIGPLFDKKDKFSLTEQMEPVEEEITDPVLERVRLVGTGTMIEAVIVDGERSTRGVAEVELGASGLTSQVVIYVLNEDGEYYTVVWDPVTNSTDILAGKQEVA